MSMLMTRFLTHAFSIQIYRYTCANLISDFPLISWFFFMSLVNVCTWMPESYHLIMCALACFYTPLGFILPLAGLLLATLYLHVQIPDIGPRWTFCWSEWRSGSIADQRKPVRSPFFPTPPARLSRFLIVAPKLLLCCSFLYISL